MEQMNVFPTNGSWATGSINWPSSIIYSKFRIVYAKTRTFWEHNIQSREHSENIIGSFWPICNCRPDSGQLQNTVFSPIFAWFYLPYFHVFSSTTNMHVIKCTIIFILFCSEKTRQKMENHGCLIWHHAFSERGGTSVERKVSQMGR